MDDNKVLIDEQNLYDIADAIRRKNGETVKYLPDEMPPAIDAIPTETGGNLAGNLATAYESLTYPVSVGTHCIYNDNYYVAIAEIETSEPFDPAKWQRITAGVEIQGLTTDLADKVDKVTGKGLSTNDYTEADKNTVQHISGSQILKLYGGNSISFSTSQLYIPKMSIFGKCVHATVEEPTPLAPITVNVSGINSDIPITVNSYTVNLSIPGGLWGIQVESGGNYIDSDGNHWICDTVSSDGLLVKRVGIATLDGTEDWRKGTSLFLNGDPFYAKFPNTYGGAPGISNMTNITTRGVTTNNNARFAMNGYQFLVYTDAVSTLEDWKTLLSNSPMIVYYALNTPVVSQLSASQLAALYFIKLQSNNTISISDTVLTEFDVSVISAI